MAADQLKPNQLNVVLDSELMRRVRQFKVETGRSVKWLVTAALTQYLDRAERKGGRTK
jgi:hypothetical protein